MFRSPVNGATVPAFPLRRVQTPLAVTTSANAFSADFSDNTSVVMISTPVAAMIHIGAYSAMTSGQRAAIMPAIYVPAGGVMVLALEGKGKSICAKAVAEAGSISVVEG